MTQRYFFFSLPNLYFYDLIIQETCRNVTIQTPTFHLYIAINHQYRTAYEIISAIISKTK